MKLAARSRTFQPHSHTDERSLLAAARSGDESAYVALLNRHDAGVIALVSAFLCDTDRDAAHSLALAAWRDALERAPEPASQHSVQTWILRCAVNRAAAHVATTQPSPAAPMQAAAEPFTPDGRWRSAPTAWSDELLDSSTLPDVLRGALAQLPPLERAAVQLRDVLGVSLDESCRVLGLCRADTRALLQQGREALRCAIDALAATPLPERSRSRAAAGRR